MIVTPQSDIYLLQDIHIDRTHTIDFNSITEQTNFFLSKQAYYLENCNFIRKENTIPVEIPYDDLMNINYMMYRNDGDKWYYCYITRKEYVSNTITKLTIETDVLQTYMFDYQLKESYIDREHQDRWTRSIDMIFPLYNEVQEDLNYGTEYIMKPSKELHQDQVKPFTDNNIKLGWFLIVSSKKLTEFGSSDSPIFRTPTPYELYLIPYDINNPDRLFKVPSPYTTDPIYNGNYYANSVTIHYFLNNFALTDEIISISFLPYLPLNIGVAYDNDNAYILAGYDLLSSKIRDGGTDSEPTFSPYRLTYINANETDMTSLNDNITSIIKTEYHDNIDLLQFVTGQPASIYYETKLKTYPYSYLTLTNYQTNPLVLKFEFLPLVFDVKYIQNLGAIVKSKFYVEGYLGDFSGKVHSIINNTVNDIPLKNNAYQQYMLNHKSTATTGVAVNVGSTLLSAGMTVAGIGLTATGVGTTAGVGMAMAGTTGILNAGKQIAVDMMKKEDLKQQPDNIRNLGNNIDFDITDGNLFLKLTEYEVTEKFKTILYNYWMLYGYKCNEVKIPNLKSRYYFNYIKTIGANIQGSLDKEIIDELKMIYDAGVTFWHYRDETTFQFKSYQYENIEISMM